MKRLSLARIWTPGTYNWLARYYDRLSVIFSPEIGHQTILGGIGPGSILDVGCGTGSLLELANRQGMECYGLDTSPGMLAQARSKVPDAHLLLGSFYEIPFSADSFDTVVETNALGGVHLDAGQGISEMLRVCKAGGEVRLVDYAIPPKMTWGHRLLIWIGSIIGDYPVDFRAIFQSHGLNPQGRTLGGYGMYQFLIAQNV